MRACRGLVALPLYLLLTCAAAASNGNLEDQQGSNAEPDYTASLSSYSDEARTVLLHVPAISAPTVTAPELHRILSQPEFLEGDLSELPRETWLSRLIEQLGRWQEALGWGTGGWPGVVGSLLLLMVLLFTAVRLSWQFFSRRARHEREPGAGVAEGRSADEMLAAATAAARSGDFREAIRFSFLALLRRLELPTTALMTNRQLLQRITQHHPHAQSAFSAVVLSYEDAWYGALPCNAEEYMRVSELARSVELDDSESLREQTTL